MAILNREEFFSRLNAQIGNSTEQESIEFLEDMTDTYNDLSERANGDGIDWKQKYHELDSSWKKKYQHRFFTGHSNSCGGSEEEEKEPIGYDDLFK